MGVRALFDRYRSRALTGCRVQARINRLRELRELLEKQQSAPEQETEPVLMPAPVVVGRIRFFDGPAGNGTGEVEWCKIAYLFCRETDTFTKGAHTIVEKLEMDLLEILREDCRLPLEKLAVMTGVTVEKVAETIDRLEKERVILRYAPTINWDKTDRERVEAMIEVRVTPQRDMGFDAVAKRIYRFEEVKSVYLMSGNYDLLVLVEARTLKELALFVSEKLSTLEMVTGTATSFVLKRYKEEGVVFEGEKSDQRLVVSP